MNTGIEFLLPALLYICILGVFLEGWMLIRCCALAVAWQLFTPLQPVLRDVLMMVAYISIIEYCYQCFLLGVKNGRRH